MLGLYAALRKDTSVKEEDKTRMEELLGKHLRDAEGRLPTERALEIAGMVAYCQIVRTKKKGFINLLMRTEHGVAAAHILAAIFDEQGKRQTEPSVPKPIFKEIKEALAAARRTSGGGKGKGGRGGKGD